MPVMHWLSVVAVLHICYTLTFVHNVGLLFSRLNRLTYAISWTFIAEYAERTEPIVDNGCASCEDLSHWKQHPIFFFFCIISECKQIYPQVWNYTSNTTGITYWTVSAHPSESPEISFLLNLVKINLKFSNFLLIFC